MSPLKTKFVDILRGLDSLIESRDYSPTMGSCLHNLRIDMLDLGKRIDEAEEK